MENLSLIQTAGDANLIIGGILIVMGLYTGIQTFRLLGKIFK